MLTELRIQDFAVIDRLTLQLGPGLNAVNALNLNERNNSK
jgi:DNA repair ATPase RecN